MSEAKSGLGKNCEKDSTSCGFLRRNLTARGYINARVAEWLRRQLFLHKKLPDYSSHPDKPFRWGWSIHRGSYHQYPYHERICAPIIARPALHSPSATAELALGRLHSCPSTRDCTGGIAARIFYDGYYYYLKKGGRRGGHEFIMI